MRAATRCVGTRVQRCARQFPSTPSPLFCFGGSVLVSIQASHCKGPRAASKHRHHPPRQSKCKEGGAHMHKRAALVQVQGALQAASHARQGPSRRAHHPHRLCLQHGGGAAHLVHPPAFACVRGGGSVGGDRGWGSEGQQRAPTRTPSRPPAPARPAACRPTHPPTHASQLTRPASPSGPPPGAG